MFFAFHENKIKASKPSAFLCAFAQNNLVLCIPNGYCKLLLFDKTFCKQHKLGLTLHHEASALNYFDKVLLDSNTTETLPYIEACKLHHRISLNCLYITR